MDLAYIGACTGAKYLDLQLAAEILRGRTVHPDIQLMIAPASREIQRRAYQDGLVETLTAAGAIWLPSSCGACLGVGPNALKGATRCISSTNRNFRGRMGSADADVYLASPATVAASAITGRIADPPQVPGVDRCHAAVLHRRCPPPLPPRAPAPPCRARTLERGRDAAAPPQRRHGAGPLARAGGTLLRDGARRPGRRGDQG